MRSTRSEEAWGTWQKSLEAVPDLAGLRDPGALDKLSGDEQEQCRALWHEIGAVHDRAKRPE